MGRDKEGLRHRAQTSGQADVQDTEVGRIILIRRMTVMMMEKQYCMIQDSKNVCCHFYKYTLQRL